MDVWEALSWWHLNMSAGHSEVSAGPLGVALSIAFAWNMELPLLCCLIYSTVRFSSTSQPPCCCWLTMVWGPFTPFTDAICLTHDLCSLNAISFWRRLGLPHSSPLGGEGAHPSLLQMIERQHSTDGAAGMETESVSTAACDTDPNTNGSIRTAPWQLCRGAAETALEFQRAHSQDPWPQSVQLCCFRSMVTLMLMPLSLGCSQTVPEPGRGTSLGRFLRMWGSSKRQPLLRDAPWLGQEGLKSALPSEVLPTLSFLPSLLPQSQTCRWSEGSPHLLLLPLPAILHGHFPCSISELSNTVLASASQGTWRDSASHPANYSTIAWLGWTPGLARTGAANGMAPYHRSNGASCCSPAPFPSPTHK